MLGIHETISNVNDVKVPLRISQSITERNP